LQMHLDSKILLNSFPQERSSWNKVLDTRTFVYLFYLFILWLDSFVCIL
jgi:hypothetical protein